MFQMDAQRRPSVLVRVRAELALQCQRCLDTMIHRVDSETRLVVVRGPDEAERLADDVEPLLVEGDRMAPRSLLEDELLLAIPAAPKHRPEDCKVRLDAVNPSAGQRSGPETTEPDAEHPFAVLADWQSDREKQD